MNDSIDLEEAKEVAYIDVGGTPANVLEKGKIPFLLSRGIRPEQIVVLMDPFDLSRVERSLILSDTGSVKKIKFSVEVPGNSEKISSEYAKPPKKDELVQRFVSDKGKIIDALCAKYQIFRRDQKQTVAQRYDDLVRNLGESAESSKNLRVFMNSLIQVMSPVPLQLKYLEEVLAGNRDKVYSVLDKRQIEARVFCPGCGKIVPYVFSKEKLEEKVCCSTANEVIQKGSYVPEEGMLPTLAYLSGISPCIGQDSSYGAKAKDILKSLGEFKRPMVMYSGNPDKTMFEDYLLRNK